VDACNVPAVQLNAKAFRMAVMEVNYTIEYSETINEKSIQVSQLTTDGVLWTTLGCGDGRG